MIRFLLASVLLFQACGPVDEYDAGHTATPLPNAQLQTSTMQNSEPVELKQSTDDGDEIVSLRLFKEFAGTYSVIVDRFYLDTKDRGIVGVDYREKYLFDLIKPDNIVITTSLVSDLGGDAANYQQLLMHGHAYANGPDTLQIYVTDVKLNGKSMSPAEAEIDFSPPFAIFLSKGKVFMESDYIHGTWLPRERYELIRQ